MLEIIGRCYEAAVILLRSHLRGAGRAANLVVSMLDLDEPAQWVDLPALWFPAFHWSQQSCDSKLKQLADSRQGSLALGSCGVGKSRTRT